MLLLAALVLILLAPALLASSTLAIAALVALVLFVAWRAWTERARVGWPALAAGDVGGMVLELLCGFVTAPSTTQTALTMATGDSLQLRSTPEGKKVRMLSPWTDQQSAGSLRVRSPRLHDNVQGIRLRSVASEVYPLLPLHWGQPLAINDTLSVDLSGSATAGDIETAVLPILYDELSGAAPRWITLDDLLRRGVNYEAVENTLSLGTGGGWSGSEAINAEFDNLKANTEYALVGFETDTECAAVAFRGIDTGNVRVGGPGHELNKALTRDWFIRLSQALGVGLIPTFNANNRAAIQIDGAQDENGADPLVNTILVELAPR